MLHEDVAEPVEGRVRRVAPAVLGVGFHGRDPAAGPGQPHHLGGHVCGVGEVDQQRTGVHQVKGTWWQSGSPHRPRHPDSLDVSDHRVHWLAMGLYVAIAVLAVLPLHTLRIEGVLLTVLMLLGVLLALMLMFAAGAPNPKAEPAGNPPPAS
jgi:hypothetical protein